MFGSEHCGVAETTLGWFAAHWCQAADGSLKSNRVLFVCYAGTAAAGSQPAAAAAQPQHAAADNAAARGQPPAASMQPQAAAPVLAAAARATSGQPCSAQAAASLAAARNLPPGVVMGIAMTEPNPLPEERPAGSGSHLEFGKRLFDDEPTAADNPMAVTDDDDDMIISAMDKPLQAEDTLTSRLQTGRYACMLFVGDIKNKVTSQNYSPYWIVSLCSTDEYFS